VAQQFLSALNDQHMRNESHLNLRSRRKYHNYIVGSTQIKVGRLEDPQHREFLTHPGPEKTTIKAFCNNYNGAFAEKSAKAHDQNNFMFLDHFIAGLLPAMPAGSVLLTLHPLPMTIAPQSDLIHARRRSGLISNSVVDGNTSFYELERVELGSLGNSVTWASYGNDAPLVGYRYTRLAQPYQGEEQAVFLCSSTHCAKAHQAKPMGATRTVLRHGTNERSTVLQIGCDCNGVGAGMTLRHRSRIAKTTKQWDV
jgi:hypothetical protein